MNYYQKNLNASKLQKCYEVVPPRIQQLLTAEIDFIVNKVSINDTVSLRFRIVAKYNEESNVAIFEMKNAIASEIPKNTYGRRQKRINLKKVEEEVLKE